MREEQTSFDKTRENVECEKTNVWIVVMDVLNDGFKISLFLNVRHDEILFDDLVDDGESGIQKIRSCDAI